MIPTMKNNLLLRLMLCVLMVSLLLAGVCCASAEEELLTDHVELYSEGCIPPDPPLLTSKSAGGFNEYILENLNAQAEEIDIRSYGMTLEEFRTAYRSLLNSRPEMFFVSGGYSYYQSSGTLTRIIPKYLYTGSELTSMQSIFNSGVSSIVNYARAASTDVGRMLRASDYMCVNFQYDTVSTSDDKYKPEKLLQNKTGVCQAYMLVYRAVLNELGITNITVSSEEMDHTWNMVYLNGSWYHIDVTWNDPISDIPNRAYHTNFLLSDAGITATDHYSWDDSYESVPSASNTKYDNFFWTNIKQAFPMKGDVLYYVDADYSTINRDVYSYNLATGATTKLLQYSYGYGTYYENYNPIWVESGTLYYAVRHELYSIPLTGGTPSLVYTTGNTNQWLWYPVGSGSTLKMYLYDSPNSGGSTVSYRMNVTTTLTANQPSARLNAGQTVQLSAIPAPLPSEPYTVAWGSANVAVATVDSSGLVTAVAPGVVKITAKYGTATAVFTVIVNSYEMMHLPSDTVEIRSEAFAGTAAGMINLPEGVKTIGSKAFANNADLLLVTLPGGVSSIASDAFSGSPNVTLLCVAGTYGEAYAITYGIPYALQP